MDRIFLHLESLRREHSGNMIRMLRNYALMLSEDERFSIERWRENFFLPLNQGEPRALVDAVFKDTGFPPGYADTFKECKDIVGTVEPHRDDPNDALRRLCNAEHSLHTVLHGTHPTWSQKALTFSRFAPVHRTHHEILAVATLLFHQPQVHLQFEELKLRLQGAPNSVLLEKIALYEHRRNRSRENRRSVEPT